MRPTKKDLKNDEIYGKVTENVKRQNKVIKKTRWSS